MYTMDEMHNIMAAGVDIFFASLLSTTANKILYVCMPA